jgi:hypothetical protein
MTIIFSGADIVDNIGKYGIRLCTCVVALRRFCELPVPAQTRGCYCAAVQISPRRNDFIQRAGNL